MADSYREKLRLDDLSRVANGCPIAKHEEVSLFLFPMMRLDNCSAIFEAEGFEGTGHSDREGSRKVS